MSEPVSVFEVELEGINATLEAMNETIDAISQQRTAEAQARTLLTNSGRGQIKDTHAIAKIWRGIAAEIKSAYSLASKIGKIGLGAGIAVGGGALYGYNKMAASAGSERYQANTRNIPSAQINALEIQFDKFYGNTLATYDKIAEVMGDKTNVERLYLQHLLGKTSAEFDKMTAVDVLKQAPEKLKGAYGKVTEKFGEGLKTEPSVRATESIGKIWDTNTLNVSQAQSGEELRQMAKDFDASLPKSGVADAELKQMQDLIRQYDQTTNEISTELKRTLVGLSEPLKLLSKEISEIVTGLVASGDAKKAVDALTGGLTTLAKYVGSNEIRSDFDVFMVGVRDAGALLHKLAHPIDALFETDTDKTGAGSNLYRKIFYGKSSESPEVIEAEREASAPLIDRVTGRKHAQPTATQKKLIDDLTDQYKLPAGLLQANTERESGFNPRAKSSAGAVGLGQLMRATAKRFGVTDRTDEAQSLTGEAKYLRVLLDKFNGNISLALAGYNAGENRESLARGNIPNIPETKEHVKVVLENMEAINANQPEVERQVAPKKRTAESIPEEQDRPLLFRTIDAFKTVNPRLKEAKISPQKNVIKGSAWLMKRTAEDIKLSYQDVFGEKKRELKLYEATVSPELEKRTAAQPKFYEKIGESVIDAFKFGNAQEQDEKPITHPFRLDNQYGNNPAMPMSNSNTRRQNVNVTTRSDIRVMPSTGSNLSTSMGGL